MEVLKQHLQALAQRIDDLTLRERMILFATLSLILYLLVNALLQAPLEAQQKTMLERTRAMQAEITALDLQTVQVIEASRHDPDAEQRQQLQALQRRAEQLQQQLAAAVANHLEPRQMNLALQEILAQQQGLRLLRIENLPAQAIQTQTEQDAATLYRHSVVMELEGDFLSTLRYVQSLEAMEWAIHWEELSLSTTRYPQALVRLRLNTLSMQRGWLGV